jgi:YHS domain-containing protein/thiol-disulfide isomerase/thioredoxin
MMILRRLRHRSAFSPLSIAAGMLCASMIASPVRATEPTPIAWREDYGGALEEAKATNRLVWIQFTGPWCPNCMRMERDSFPDADVIDHAQRSFVPLKLRSDVHERLALGFNLSGLPATVLVTPTREIVAVRQGYLGPDELEQLLSQGLAAWRDREAAGKAAAAGTKNGAASRPDPAARAKDEVRLALSGYCPVSLIADRRLVRGASAHTLQHDGHIYRFASADLSNHFRKDPERYIPVNRGNCPVTQVDQGAVKPGDPRWGVLYQGRLFVCASDEARRLFLGDPQRYAMVDVAEQGFCPHCLGETGLLVRGDPKYAITREGRRYWFPDSTHRAAFLAANPSAMATSTATAADTANGPATTTRR